jgi:membrane protein DedA with SNARE-associated domain
MRFIIFCVVAALAGYIFGYIVGRWTAEAEVEVARKEMDLEEDDEYDLFK